MVYDINVISLEINNLALKSLLVNKYLLVVEHRHGRQAHALTVSFRTCHHSIQTDTQNNIWYEISFVASSMKKKATPLSPKQKKGSRDGFDPPTMCITIFPNLFLGQEYTVSWSIHYP